MNKTLLKKLCEYHHKNNKSFVEFIERNKRLFDKTSDLGVNAYKTLHDCILPQDYLEDNIVLSEIPQKSMILIRYVIDGYHDYINYIDLNGLGVGTKFSELEIELAAPDNYVTVYIPISDLTYKEYDESLTEDNDLEYTYTWYVAEKGNINNAVNTVFDKLYEFDNLIGKDILSVGCDINGTA